MQREIWYHLFLCIPFSHHASIKYLLNIWRDHKIFGAPMDTIGWNPKPLPNPPTTSQGPYTHKAMGENLYPYLHSTVAKLVGALGPWVWLPSLCPTSLGQRESLPCMTCHGSVCVMCIRFLLQDVHQFESPWLSDMSNLLFQGRQHVVRGRVKGFMNMNWIAIIIVLQLLMVLVHDLSIKFNLSKLELKHESKDSLVAQVCV
jgi:hypothetical protein